MPEDTGKEFIAPKEGLLVRVKYPGILYGLTKAIADANLKAGSRPIKKVLREESSRQGLGSEAEGLLEEEEKSPLEGGITIGILELGKPDSPVIDRTTVILDARRYTEEEKPHVGFDIYSAIDVRTKEFQGGDFSQIKDPQKLAPILQEKGLNVVIKKFRVSRGSPPEDFIEILGENSRLLLIYYPSGSEESKGSWKLFLEDSQAAKEEDFILEEDFSGKPLVGEKDFSKTLNGYGEALGKTIDAIQQLAEFLPLGYLTLTLEPPCNLNIDPLHLQPYLDPEAIMQYTKPLSTPDLRKRFPRN